jgi:hypothetical protein
VSERASVCVYVCVHKSCRVRRPRPGRLREHRGCVNALHFDSDTGALLLSGSDDRQVILWNWQEERILLKYDSLHHGNVFQAKPMPRTVRRATKCPMPREEDDSHAHVYICMCVYVCVSVSVCLHVCVCMYVCMCVYMCLCLCVYVSLSLSVCVYAGQSNHRHLRGRRRGTGGPSIHEPPPPTCLYAQWRLSHRHVRVCMCACVCACVHLCVCMCVRLLCMWTGACGLSVGDGAVDVAPAAPARRPRPQAFARARVILLLSYLRRGRPGACVLPGQIHVCPCACLRVRLYLWVYVFVCACVGTRVWVFLFLRAFVSAPFCLCLCLCLCVCVPVCLGLMDGHVDGV